MTHEDLETISALGIRSKASWGYDGEAMAIFSEELSLSENDFDAFCDALVATTTVDEEIVGYVALRLKPEGEMELDYLFVDPPWFGKGIGTLLGKAALSAARARGHDSVVLIADPNSEGFYRKLGAEVIGWHQSRIPGRVIPVMRMRV